MKPSSSPLASHDGFSVRFIATALVIAFLASPLAGPVAAAATPQGTATPVKHVIMITMENHSFDNILGKYPLIQGGNQSLVANISRPVNLLSGNVSEALKSVPSGSFSTGNPREGYSAYHLDWNNGKMNNFLNGSGPNSLYYFTSSQMALEWDLIQQYALGDRYFSSTLSETVPNRLFGIAGYSPVINDYGPPPYIPQNQTIFHQLSTNGVSWGYYMKSLGSGLGPISLVNGIGTYSSNVQNWGSFYGQLANGTLPSVSWLEPIQGGGDVYSQHPTYSMLTGELWLLYTINAVMNSPIWNTTAIFVNYDENGGYYDNVAPPSIDGNQLGIRVPFFVISPYAKENYVSSTTLSHTSLLAFIEYNWKLPALNKLVQDSNIPTDFFNFNSKYPGGNVARPPLALPPNIVSMIPASYDFNPSEYSHVGNISSLFPMKFQIPLNNITYSFHGNSSTSLGSLGYGVNTVKNVSYTPFYESMYSVEIVLVAGSAALFILSRHWVAGKK